MAMSNAYDSSVHMHYSPDARSSIGYKGIWHETEDTAFHGLQYNRLLKRWNQRASQGNLYWKNIVGLTDTDGTVGGGLMSNLAADWETRRHFVSYDIEVGTHGTAGGSFSQQGRLGVAPYIGHYGDLHTWLMLQVDHRPTEAEPLSVTPLLRFFKGTHLWELGNSLSTGDIMLNYIKRF